MIPIAMIPIAMIPIAMIPIAMIPIAMIPIAMIPIITATTTSTQALPPTQTITKTLWTTMAKRA
jgi:carbohydrate-binding DOMON domain-containing protein